MQKPRKFRDCRFFVLISGRCLYQLTIFRGSTVPVFDWLPLLLVVVASEAVAAEGTKALIIIINKTLRFFPYGDCRLYSYFFYFSANWRKFKISTSSSISLPLQWLHRQAPPGGIVPGESWVLLLFSLRGLPFLVASGRRVLLLLSLLFFVWCRLIYWTKWRGKRQDE